MGNLYHVTANLTRRRKDFRRPLSRREDGVFTNREYAREDHRGRVIADWTIAKLSCDSCRTRKIKCDKGSPCSHCRAAGKHCQTSNPKPLGPRQRVLISSQYEKKIDRIEERLASLETTLKTIATSLTASNYGRPGATPSSIHSIPDRTKSRAESVDNDDSPPFEGETSLTAHSVQASEYLSKAVGNSPGTSGLMSALQGLKRVVSKQNSNVPLGQMRFQPQSERNGFNAASLRLPSIEAVMSLIRERGRGCRLDAFFEICFPYSGLDKFKELLKSIYFNTEGFPTATAVLVFGGLYYLFLEACAAPKREGKDPEPAIVANMMLCRDNIELCLDHLELLVPATDENVCALLLGATYAVEKSKPTLCWALTTAAIGLAQSLGYHRADSPCDDLDTRARRTCAFWSLYILDKSLSLRLGRASTIQDFDITITPLGYPSNADDLSNHIWTALMSCWVQFASIQGRIYEKLYSPSALASPLEERTVNANNLATELEELRTKWAEVDVDSLDRDKGLYYAQGVRQADYVSHLASLTLIYRAASPSAHPNERCVGYARQTLEAHQQAYLRYKETDAALWEGYLHWAVIHAPFTPFIVLFCHVIATSDAEDLCRIGQFASSLQSAAQTTEAAAKFYRLCQIFHQVATLYVETKARGNATSSSDPAKPEDLSNGLAAPVPYAEDTVLGMGVPWGEFPVSESVPLSEVDQYLGALGFAPRRIGPMDTKANTVEGDFASGDSAMSYDAAGLETWFQGNQYMMNLLEQDLSYLDRRPQ